MAESKQYKDLTPEERYKSAIEADKAPWNPLKAAKEMIVEKFSPKKDDKAPQEKKFKKGGSVGSASKRADGCCVKGKTKGKMI
jgi:hypothetical protein